MFQYLNLICFDTKTNIGITVHENNKKNDYGSILLQTILTLEKKKKFFLKMGKKIDLDKNRAEQKFIISGTII